MSGYATTPATASTSPTSATSSACPRRCAGVAEHGRRRGGGDVRQCVLPLAAALPSGWRRARRNPPTDTLAFGAFVQESAGTLPFYELPSLGGSHTLRGYIANRFTDNSAGTLWQSIASGSSPGASRSPERFESSGSGWRCSAKRARSRTVWTGSGRARPHQLWGRAACRPGAAGALQGRRGGSSDGFNVTVGFGFPSDGLRLRASTQSSRAEIVPGMMFLRASAGSGRVTGAPRRPRAAFSMP